MKSLKPAAKSTTTYDPFLPKVKSEKAAKSCPIEINLLNLHSELRIFKTKITSYGNEKNIPTF